jgi:hypothetical protein
MRGQLAKRMMSSIFYEEDGYSSIFNGLVDLFNLSFQRPLLFAKRKEPWATAIFSQY